MKSNLLVLTLVTILCQPAYAEVQDEITTIFTPYQSIEARDKLLDIILSAKSKIRIAAYGFTNPDICAALLRKKLERIDIEIVMDKTQAASPYQKPLVEKLRKAEIPVNLGKSKVKNQLQHCKFIVVDDKLTEDGSFNYGVTALDQDNVLNFIESPVRAKMFTEYWEQIKKDMK